MKNIQYLTEKTAALFPSEINDGFVRPHLGWSAFGPAHLEDVGSGELTSNIWIGEPAKMRSFIEELATQYETLKNKQDGFDIGFDDVSLGYWEKNGFAMVGEFCTGHVFLENTPEIVNEMKFLNFFPAIAMTVTVH